MAIMHAGRIIDTSTARHVLEEGILDLVGMTREHMADPYIARKLDAWAPPTASTASTSARKKVVVTHSLTRGISTLAHCSGHEVVLEASRRLGGKIAMAAKAPWRRDLEGIVSWRVAQLERLRAYTCCLSAMRTRRRCSPTRCSCVQYKTLFLFFSPLVS